MQRNAIRALRFALLHRFTACHDQRLSRSARTPAAVRGDRTRLTSPRATITPRDQM